MRMGTREGLIGVVLLAIPLSSWWLVFRPQNTAIDTAKREVAHKRDLLEKLKQHTSRNQDLAEANQEMNDRIRAIEGRFPGVKEVDSIVRQVSDVAVLCRLNAPTVANVKPRQEAMYMEQPLDMTLSGNWEGFYDFLARVEQLPRITRISNMLLRRDDKGDGDMKAEFTLSIYYQQSPANAAAANNAPGAPKKGAAPARKAGGR
ncbi:MAG: type 4a pilus biogenesis protein PilO [Phycisphaeraceae bacterium]|nr:type 4a pilus biogenesis protein PilO [Phycisphaerae bacterium]MBX3391991.1 type 4a pilus biogenesis protein PilO [Phycisphaeraceae bacterium]